MAIRNIRAKALCLMLALTVWSMQAQERRFTVSGNIRDEVNGEDMIGAAVMIKGERSGAVTNAYGFYSVSLPAGRHVLLVSYVGYAAKEIAVDLSADRRLNISLRPNVQELGEVVVAADGLNANVAKAEMSVEKLSAATIKSVPALMGEVDVIKAIQLLPGVQSTSEGTSGFSVRGGGYDQNLILLDEAAVYSASHLMGFFSVFNNDAVKDVTLYKGDIPASNGGRLASLLDIRTKDGNSRRFAATGGIGLISSRLTLEGPLSPKVSAIVSGRRTYADMFLALADDERMRQSILYFYDMNAKINYRIDDNNRLFLAGYFGRDKLGMSLAGMDFGNKTVTARWNHIFSPKLFSNFSLIGSMYDYYIKMELNEQVGQELKSGLDDYGFKADFSYSPSPAHHIRFGYHFTHHSFRPGEGGGTGEESVVGRIKFADQFAMENVLYLANETNAGDHLKLKYGLRYTAFSNLDKGRVINNRQQFEPRAGATYIFNDLHSVKASYSRTAQFVQLASNSTSGSILSLWFPSSAYVKPQKCDQYALGYFRNMAENRYELSAEIYYKDMTDVVDFRDHAQLLLNDNLEEELLFGRGYSYGLELMLRKTSGPFSGWISYTFARGMRQINGINNNLWYRSPYDKPHNISIVASYDLAERISLSANWVYADGSPVTYPTGRYQIEGEYVPIYSGRNEYRYPAYHRLDLSAVWRLSSPGSRLKHELNLSLYNAYGRKNAWIIHFRPEDDRPNVMYAEKIYLFTFVPSITWNFSF
ncbi:MAG: TonB-dependent receptor [Tannerellaceae bacterium]|jgi:hypothetical protein|nr:TonB-dependent receptor [Tannerellaceae bacterium]